MSLAPQTHCLKPGGQYCILGMAKLLRGAVPVAAQSFVLNSQAYNYRQV